MRVTRVGRRLAGVMAVLCMIGPPTPTLAQVATLRPPVVEGAEKVRVEHVKVFSEEIAGNLLGTSPERDVFVVLPPSYDRDPARRYPVVYALHGYSIGAEQWLGELHMPQTAEGAFAKGTPEMIIVFPSSKNEHNGAFYSNSPTTGNFENWIADELIDYVDSHYRTLAQPASRGLVGHSMGGYGASRIGIRRAEKYGALYLMSPCCQSTLGSRGLTAEQVRTIEALPSVAAARELPFASRGPLAIASAFRPIRGNRRFTSIYRSIPTATKGRTFSRSGAPMHRSRSSTSTFTRYANIARSRSTSATRTDWWATRGKCTRPFWLTTSPTHSISMTATTPIASASGCRIMSCRSSGERLRLKASSRRARPQSRDTGPVIVALVSSWARSTSACMAFAAAASSRSTMASKTLA